VTQKKVTVTGTFEVTVNTDHFEEDGDPVQVTLRDYLDEEGIEGMLAILTSEDCVSEEWEVTGE
jgi:hypothetical protein